MARTGRPVGWNSVIVALTDLTTPMNGGVAPHVNITIGGNGLFIMSDAGVGRTVENSSSTIGATVPCGMSVTSRNTSTSSVRIWLPVNSGGSADFFDGLKFHPDCSDML